MLRKLWSDEAGAIISAEIVLVATILVIGMIVGLKSVRDSVVTELADVAQAIANLDQSYSFTGITGHGASSAGAWFFDTQDYCDISTNEATLGDLSKCVIVGIQALGEAGNGGG